MKRCFRGRRGGDANKQEAHNQKTRMTKLTMMEKETGPEGGCLLEEKEEILKINGWALRLNPNDKDMKVSRIYHHFS